MMKGEKITSKKIFEVEVFFSSKNIAKLKDDLFSFLQYFFHSFSMLCLLRTWDFDDI
jgi:hypothetical protein